MSMAHVELELAREPAHPFGDREHIYDLYLPLRADGRIDGERAECDGRCRFRCRKPDGRTTFGTIRLGREGRLQLEYCDVPGSGQVALPNIDNPFHAGQLLPIADLSGEAHLFQVLFVRQEGASRTDVVTA
ncbi:MAG TPA: hypothetical protein VN109_12485 [Devosia sp.]|nr:hypothetical protein [Devosia sp.]